MTSKRDRKAAFIFIIAVGFVSLFADMTYEGARSVVGPFLKDLGASATQVGIIAGADERGPSVVDQRHRAVVTFHYRFPWNFTAGTLAMFASSRPFNATTGVDNN